MFLRLKLHNIESHSDTEFDFHPVSNALIGSTGAGKSVVERALNSLLFFRTMRSRFDETHSSIELTHCKGTLGRYREDLIKWECSNCKKLTVKRLDKSKCCQAEMTIKRIKVSDVYKLNGEELAVEGKGFAQLIDDIKKSIPIALLDVGDKDPYPVGVKGQFDGFIWKQLSPQQLSRVFSYLEGNDYVHLMQAYIKKDIYKDKNTLKVLIPEIEDITKSLLGTDDIILDKQHEYDLRQRERDNLVGVYDTFENLLLLSDKYGKIISKGQKISGELSELNFIPWKRSENLLKQLETFGNLRESYDNSQRDVDLLQSALLRNKAVDIETVREKLEALKSMELGKKTFQDKLWKYQKLQGKYEDVKETLQKDKKLLDEILKDNNICPYSGFPLNPECKQMILQEVG